MKRARSQSPEEEVESAEVRDLPPVLDAHNDREKGGERYAFKPDFNDHFETSVTAFMDLIPVLAELRQSHKSLRRVPFKTLAQEGDAPATKQGFVAYDPYYCNGLVKQVLARLGLVDESDAEHSGPKSWYPTVSHAYNENRDFYADVAAPGGFPFYSWQEHAAIGFGGDTVPLTERLCAEGYSMCVTNPPYSEDHIMRFLREFAIPSHRPWAMLVPDYIPSKKWFKDLIAEVYQTAIPTEEVAKEDAPAKPAFIAPPRRTTPGKVDLPFMLLAKGTGGLDPANAPVAFEPAEPFYLFPKGQQSRYEFHHPKRVGREQSHFGSLWVVWCGYRPEVVEGAPVAQHEAKSPIEAGNDAELPSDVTVGAVPVAEAAPPVPLAHKPTNEERARHNAVLKALRQGGYEEVRKRVVLRDIGGDADKLVRDLLTKEDDMLLKRRGYTGNTERTLVIMSNLAELYPPAPPVRRDYNNNAFNSRGGNGRGRGVGRGGGGGRGGGRGFAFGRGSFRR